MLHTHSHGHDHAHCGHQEAGGGNIRRLTLVLILTGTYMIIEFLGGLWSNSLALLADAGHMLADVGAIGLALFAAWVSTHPASPQRTYGYYRVEIFAAFINGIFLAVAAFYIFYEAWGRMQQPQSVEGQLMIWIALGGLIINLISAYILYSPGQKNINMQGAFLHVLSDSLGSMGAILAGLAVLFWGFYQVDALFSVLIGLLVLVNAWKLIQETTEVLLESSPKHLSVPEIRNALTCMPEVLAVHDLHVWSITSGKEAMSVHVVVRDLADFTPALVTKIQHELKHTFGLTHLTVQLEPPDFEEDDIHF